VITNIIDQLTRDEGVKLSLYFDQFGFATIGIGRLIDARKGGGLTLTEAQFLLQNDVTRTKQMLEETFPWVTGLSEARYGVLLNMAFNLGVHGLGEFREFLAAVQAGDWEKASQEMLSSVWAKQVESRVARLALQMRSDAWQ
jgi:lysozyme